MASQILAQHLCGNRIYNLGGLRTGSIRDQLLRANLIANCLIDEHQISRVNPLLIIGAGAAGMCAAMTAAYLGVQVTVIEEKPDPFCTFRNSSWRRVSPFEYDWPHEISNTANRFPTANGWFPLTFTGPDTADNLAAIWHFEWQDWLNNFDGQNGKGTIKIVNDDAWKFIKSLNYDQKTPKLTVHGPWNSNLSSDEEFGAIILAAGFLSERTSSEDVPDPWHGYRGPRFWDEDDNIPNDSSNFNFREVVISGSGDGAMQDFQRVLTGSFGQELFFKFEDRLKAVRRLSRNRYKSIYGELTAKIFDANYVGLRMHACQRTSKSPQTGMWDWHYKFESATFEFLKNLQLSTSERNYIARNLFRSEFINGRSGLIWIFKDSVPSYCYALNRFLSMLLQGLAPPNVKLQVKPNSEILEIKPPPTPQHQCGNPDNCIGIPHDVILKDGNTTRNINGVDLIIVRHGIIKNPISDKGPSIPEQIAPLDLPL